jgi:HAD superfamily hydrolase (TIGR01509 family)
MRRLSDFDAVTIDAFGTLVELLDPVPELTAALHERGVACTTDQVARGVGAEFAYYRARTTEGADDVTLERLRHACTQVFLDAAEVDIGAASFTRTYVEALRFRPLPGVPEELDRLAARGVALAVVSNWDASLAETLRQLELDRYFAVVVTSAEAGVAKPDPRPFRLALERLGAEARRAVHVGDGTADEEGARAAGMAFVPAPLPGALGDA